MRKDKIMFLSRKMTWIGGTLLVLATLPALADVALTARKPIVIPGGPGGFDWMLVDARSNRVFATHKGTKSVAIVDMTTGTALPSVEVGTAQGIAIDRKDNKIFLGDEDEHKIVVLDYMTLKKTGEIAVTGPVDDLAYCSKNSTVYADCDNGTEVWAIDAKTEKIVATIKVPTAPEKIEFDRTSGKIYQNIKSDNSVQVIDPDTNKVEKKFDTAPAVGPHGLAIDSKKGWLFSAGSNGKLVVIDLKTGKVTSTVDIEKGVDQIAFDRSNGRIYCACKGFISVVEETETGAKLVGNVPSPKGAHTLAVDSKTHAVWTCYSDEKQSYLLKLTPPEQTKAE